MHVLVLDNYDSFTYNLVDLVKQCGASVDVFRNDEITIDEIDNYDTIILSPGPGIPKDAGIMPELLHTYQNSKKILGVCLGLQAITQTFGGKIINLNKPYHGTGLPVKHNQSVLFRNIPQQFIAGRYHSWAAENPLPECLEVTATDDENIIMAFAHKILPVFGVQFHPESILTQHGKILVENFINL